MAIVLPLLLLLAGRSGGSELQHFLQRPADAQVAEGGAAILRCQVGGQVGQVQWTKDGLTLGYDRDLPGFDRYSVLGNDAAGTYNLKVANATLSDSAKYECQVGPGRGNPPIRANARLTVTLPPTRIEILNHEPGARVEVGEHEEVELACRVSNAKPRADVVWYRNNVEFDPGPGNIEESEEEGSLSRRITSLSRIRFRPGSEDNQATFACEAEHPALRGAPGRAPRPMRAAVLLSVLFPPEKPEITGYIEGETIRMGATVKMVCQAFGGNPLAQVIWFKNNQRIDHSYTTTGARSENTFMFLAQPDDNNAVYRCEAKNRMVTQPLTAEIVMSVQFAPDSVEIRGPSTAKVGDVLTFECITSNSNPASSLQWVVDGRTVPGRHNRTDTSAEGGWVSMANMSLTVAEQDKMKTVSCYANNLALSETKVETHIVTVLYPPDAPSITGYRSGEVVREGELRRVKCTALSGNPLPSLEWWAGGERLLEGVTLETGAGGTFVSAQLALTADRTDNGKIYECRARNDATAVAVASAVQLAVSFPPRRVTVSVRPERPAVGQEARLLCSADSSSPGTQLVWWLGDEQVAAGGPPLRREGDWGGAITEVELRVPVTEAHISAVFRCEAKHKETSKSLHNVTTIAVQYKPRFVEGPREVSLEAGGSREVRLPAQASPPVSAYEWVRKGGAAVPEGPGAGPGVAAEGSTLHLREVTRGDAGTYILRAENRLGKARRAVVVRVLHPPDIVSVSGTQLVSQGDSVRLECGVSASPLPPDTVRWLRPGYSFGARSRVEATRNGSVLTIANVTSADAGSFHCVASNGIPRAAPLEVRETVFLLVHQPPTLLSAPSLLRAASEVGSPAELVCRATAAPNVTFSWSRTDKDPLPPGHAVEPTVQLDPFTWESRLRLDRLRTEDFGAYTCRAANQWGASRQEVALGPRTRPDPPSRLAVHAAAYNSVTLSWQPGFSGGFPQYFRVRLRREDSGSFLFVDVFPHNATEFTVEELQMDSSYSFTVMAFNKLGESGHSGAVRAATASQPPPGARHRLLEAVLEQRGDIPFIIILTVSAAGVLLLCLNAALLYCFVQHRRAAGPLDSVSEGSSAGSSKAATIEMYVGSTYNDALSGETLSSLSEKSDPYFTTELSGRHRADYSEEFPSSPRGPGPVGHYLVEHNHIYGAAAAGHHRPDEYDPGLPSRPVSRALAACTLPRQPQGGRPSPRHQGLARQRSVSNLDSEGRDQDSLVWL